MVEIRTATMGFESHRDNSDCVQIHENQNAKCDTDSLIDVILSNVID